MIEERTIVRHRGGTAERTVRLSEIAVPDVPDLSVGHIELVWIKSAHQLHADVARLLTELCTVGKPSRDLFIPNYWKAAMRLPEKQRAPLLELWHLAHDLGNETMRLDYNRFREDRSGVSGMVYYTSSYAA